MLLHVCCADCLLRYLIASGYPLPPNCQTFIFNPSQYRSCAKRFPWPLELVFANSNIYPKSEYDARLKAVQKLAAALNLHLTISNYQPHLYFNLPPCAAQLSTSIVNNARCAACQNWRLQFVHQLAAQTLPPAPNPKHRRWSTTMLVSPYLNSQQIKKIARSLDTNPQLHFYSPRWRIPPHQIRTTGFYKQNYCGCLFSLFTRAQEKFLSSASKPN